MQVFLIRHPRPLIDAGLCYGQLDVDCEDPLLVAARIKSMLPAGTPVVSSPLRRARRLAEALDDQPLIDSRLSEISFGDWEGRAWNDIERKSLDAWAADVLGFTPPGGESISSLRMRAIDFATSLDLPRVALVTHAGIIRVLVGYWQRIPVAGWTQLKFDFGSITEIEIGNGHETTQT